MATVKAVYEGGVFKPKEPVHLAEHTEVEVSLPTAAVPPAEADDPTGWKTMRELIGVAGDAGGTAPTNAAEDHDEILYGPGR
jgi:hypothetical protein